jgi:uncharacterized membrane protein
MNIATFFTLYVLSVPIFMVIDILWLGLVAKDFYHKQIGHLMGEINWTAAVLFYLLFLLGLTFFAIYPAATKGTWMTALFLGGMFGFFSYMTYDMTNLATLRGWPVQLVIVDIIWGTFLGASVAVGVFFLKQFFV